MEVKIPGRVIFKAVVGSQAYGTNVEGSDTDIKGVYVQSAMDILTYGYKEQVEVSKDEVYYEVRRFLELLETANPTMLELLFMPKDCIISSSVEFSLILKYREKFLTKKCRHSFGGYAIQQIKKAKGLNKKMNWEKEDMVRKTPLDFCYVSSGSKGSTPLKEWLKARGAKQEHCGLINVDHMKDCYHIFTDIGEIHNYHGLIADNSNALRLSSIPVGLAPNGLLYYNKDGYTQHCNVYKEYETWLKERNEQRYVDLEGHGQKIDGKNMLHCQRLIDTAYDIATQGELIVRRPNAEYLKSIRKGKVNLQTLLDNAETSINEMDHAFEGSNLPESAPPELKQQLLEMIRGMVGYNKIESTVIRL